MLKQLSSGETFLVRKSGNRNSGKTVAILEQLYDMIARAHEETLH